MDVKCNDCGFPSREMTEKSLKAGSSVREPGEALCEGCSSRRILMVRVVNKLPGTIAGILAKRMALNIGSNEVMG